MKYIKSYKIFESSDESLSVEIKSYLSQIFLELEDEGYDVDIEGRWKPNWDRPPYDSQDLTGFKIKISGKIVKEGILPAIETSINYMSDEGFGNHWINLDNFGTLNFEELKNYFNIKKSLVNKLENKNLVLNFIDNFKNY
jgi:hypothetical protein